MYTCFHGVDHIVDIYVQNLLYILCIYIYRYITFLTYTFLYIYIYIVSTSLRIGNGIPYERRWA